MAEKWTPQCCKTGTSKLKPAVLNMRALALKGQCKENTVRHNSFSHLNCQEYTVRAVRVGDLEDKIGTRGRTTRTEEKLGQEKTKFNHKSW